VPDEKKHLITLDEPKAAAAAEHDLDQTPSPNADRGASKVFGIGIG